MSGRKTSSPNTIKDRPRFLRTLLRWPMLCAGLVLWITASCSGSQSPDFRVRRILVSDEIYGWARNSVNAVIFRKDPVASNGEFQYVAYYDSAGTIVLGVRPLDAPAFRVRRTAYRGNVGDAHNTICLGVDGAGVLHAAWDHHGKPLNYHRSAGPGSLELTGALPMTGQFEARVTYPEFYRLPGGDLLFLYRDGSSGNGNTLLNRYDVATETWRAVQHPLIDGEGERNAYTNRIAVDSDGGLHLSWCWRESGDVATNHDLCYAYSPDEGATWWTSTGRQYTLPITAATAEYVLRIPQGSELINQTTMTTDSQGRPFIATYWRPAGSPGPDYRLVFHDGDVWQVRQISRRATSFSLSGGGTKRIPISRPLILVDRQDRAYVIFRDAERGNRVSMTMSADADYADWQVVDLSDESVGFWEPSYDTDLWGRTGELHLYVQRVGQGDGETEEAVPPQPVMLYEVTLP